MVNPCKPNAINHAQVGLMNWDDLKWPQMVGIWLVTGMVYGICLTTLLITDDQVRKSFSALWITNSSVIWDSRLNRLHAIRWRRCFVDVGWPCRWRRCSLVTKHCWWFWMFVDQGFTKTHGFWDGMGMYGDTDRSRWRGPLFWSFLDNLNKHQICRKPSHFYHFLKTHHGTSGWSIHILEPPSKDPIPRTTAVCFRPGPGQKYRRMFPPPIWDDDDHPARSWRQWLRQWMTSSSLRPPYPPKKRAWKSTKPWFCQWAVLTIIIIKSLCNNNNYKYNINEYIYIYIYIYILCRYAADIRGDIQF